MSYSVAKPAAQRRPTPPQPPKPRGAKFWPALGFAALSGSRATSAPAFLSQYLSSQALAPGLAQSPLRFLAKPGVATALKFLVAGELVGDKLPNTPNRIVPQQLSARAASGALVGATVYKTKGGSALSGALVGALGAVAATYITYYLRKTLSEKTNTNTSLIGAGEDALVLGLGAALAKSQETVPA
ncbi:hypothetical protein GO988_07110 [Hymenobacter sp. HMF4947]|uniref:DUF4126 domain-containing protein n=1 Tax=Hymenobacter ginkgonis TaxID=2682976 RepID=A0A7K1TCF5_9BACT|nr:DUF4126 family protein [Hymenobacter ginkgonis]MVN76089.1 hypothetical protein [Hymenobacter ginkgonis]